MELLEKWIYECLGVLIKEPTEENRKIIAKTIASEIEDREKGTKIENRIIGLKKQKAIDFVGRINKECDGSWFNKYFLTDLLVMFATENDIQWHKVSEELPKAEIGIHNVETYRVLKLNAYKNPVECYCSYNNRTQKFETVVDTKKSVYWKEIKDVVAWQEIPLVPEEVKTWLIV